MFINFLSIRELYCIAEYIKQLWHCPQGNNSYGFTIKHTFPDCSAHNTTQNYCVSPRDGIALDLQPFFHKRRTTALGSCQNFCSLNMIQKLFF